MSSEILMEMLILAGGFGTRLKAAVHDVPKPMASINGTPLLNLQIDHWIRQGQRSFVFLLHHQADLIIDFLVAKSKKLGEYINITWIVEETPLGTGGSVSHAIHKNNLTGDVLIANADTWLTGGLDQLSRSKGAAIAVIRSSDTSRYGSIVMDKNYFLIKFVEKNVNLGNENSGLINAGLYKLPTSIFHSEKAKEFSLETEILPQMSSKKLLKAEVLNGIFFDIGVPEDYNKFCEWYQINEKNE